MSRRTRVIDADASERPYEVGYGKPPIATRFKKGQSGNPKGRRAKALNAGTILRTAMEQPQTVTVGGKPQTMSTFEVLVRKTIEGAISGNIKAFQTVIALIVEHAPEILIPAVQKLVAADDKALLDDFMARVAGPSANVEHGAPGDD